MATLVTPQDWNQSARSCRSWVNVPKARTGMASASGLTAAMCMVEPISIAAALGFTTFKSGWPPVLRFVMASPSFKAKGVGHASSSSS